MNNAAVGANRNINAGFFKIFISCLAYLYKRGGLSSAYALCLAGNAYRAAAYTYLYKVGACFRQEQKALAVNNISGACLYGIAVFFAYKFKRTRLPLAEALR